MAQLEQRRLPRRLQSAKMRSQGGPRTPKCSQKASQDRQNEATKGQEQPNTTQEALGIAKPSKTQENMAKPRQDLAKRRQTQQLSYNCKFERHLKSTYVLTEWRQHLKSIYLQT